MPCSSHSCQCLTAACATLLALAWLLWFPFAFREKKLPIALAWVALLATCAAVIIAALFMPYTCRSCGGLP